MGYLLHYYKDVTFKVLPFIVDIVLTCNELFSCVNLSGYLVKLSLIVEVANWVQKKMGYFKHK